MFYIYYNRYMKSFIIKKIEEGKNISSVIQKRYPHLSQNSLLKAFRMKDIKCFKKVIDKNYISKEDDEIFLYIKDEILYGIKSDIRICYEDNNILVVYKPKGVASCDSKTSIPDFNKMVKTNICKDALICHRLDTNTEGLLIFAKNDIAYEQILEAFKNRNIKKEYVTLVYSKPKKDHDTLEAYIVQDNKSSFAKVFDTKVANSTEISTKYTLLQYIANLNVSILKVEIHTGKTHQIRAHMKHLGIPIIGDSKYTDIKINKKFKLKYQVLYAAAYSFNFDSSSMLRYLNDVHIDISDECICNIKKLLNI